MKSVSSPKQQQQQQQQQSKSPTLSKDSSVDYEIEDNSDMLKTLGFASFGESKSVTAAKKKSNHDIDLKDGDDAKTNDLKRRKKNSEVIVISDDDSEGDDEDTGNKSAVSSPSSKVRKTRAQKKADKHAFNQQKKREKLIAAGIDPDQHEKEQQEKLLKQQQNKKPPITWLDIGTGKTDLGDGNYVFYVPNFFAEEGKLLKMKNPVARSGIKGVSPKTSPKNSPSTNPTDPDSIQHTYTSLQEFFTDQIPWNQGSVKMFGKDIPEPRLTCYYGDYDYKYSGKLMKRIPFAEAPAIINVLKKMCEEQWEKQFGYKYLFNSVLLNRYRNGKDSMGWHNDLEPVYGDKPQIASITFLSSGTSPREFQFRRNDSEKRSDRARVGLENGSLLFMCGDSFQKIWQHQLPKVTPSKSEMYGERINLTFRQVVNDVAGKKY